MTSKELLELDQKLEIYRYPPIIFPIIPPKQAKKADYERYDQNYPQIKREVRKIHDITETLTIKFEIDRASRTLKALSNESQI